MEQNNITKKIENLEILPKQEDKNSDGVVELPSTSEMTESECGDHDWCGRCGKGSYLCRCTPEDQHEEEEGERCEDCGQWPYHCDCPIKWVPLGKEEIGMGVLVNSQFVHCEDRDCEYCNKTFKPID